VFNENSSSKYAKFGSFDEKTGVSYANGSVAEPSCGNGVVKRKWAATMRTGYILPLTFTGTITYNCENNKQVGGLTWKLEPIK
jgi:hypothetical protein